MKRILLSISLVMLYLTANSQTMTVKMKSGAVVSYNTEDVVEVTFIEKDDEPNYEYVDLGLSVKWATMNIGASSPEEYGDFFAWGETEPYYTSDDYWWSSYKWCNGRYDSMTKYTTGDENCYNGNNDGKAVLELEDDAAHANWGGNWRMPTIDELNELSSTNNCTWTWFDSGNSEFYGVAGYKVTSKKPGYIDKYIFLPATDQGANGNYGSSSLYTYDSSLAYSLYFRSSRRDKSFNKRCDGLSVRPVVPNPNRGVTSVCLDKTSLAMYEGEFETLMATTLPSIADNTGVVWSSNDNDIAVVDGNGQVTAVAAGSCTITVRSSVNSSISTTCNVTVNAPAPITDANVHEYVDLGLSVKWATMNVGASKPEEYGDYFAWGETATKNYYHTSTYFDTGGFFVFKKYNHEGGKTVLDPADDAAHIYWGDRWRMPTQAELEELSNTSNCTWTWYNSGDPEFNGVAGYKITSNKPGHTDKYIFLPAAGCHIEWTLGYDEQGQNGYYWSSSLCSHPDCPELAYELVIDSNGHECDGWGDNRYYGLSVRPVIK